MNKSIQKKKIHRRFSRRSARSNVRITCHKKRLHDDGTMLIAVALDLSEAGARLLVREPLEVGEEIVLGLESPSYQTPLTRHGKVMWSFPVTEHSFVAGVWLREQIATEDVREATVHPVRLDY
jgi:Tfp pilus assembly protein PilZ